MTSWPMRVAGLETQVRAVDLTYLRLHHVEHGAHEDTGNLGHTIPIVGATSNWACGVLVRAIAS